MKLWLCLLKLTLIPAQTATVIYTWFGLNLISQVYPAAIPEVY